MGRWITSCAVLGVVLAMTVALRAADENAAPAADKQDKKEAKAEAKEAKGEAKEAKKEARLTQPWRRLTGLSEEQKTQIADIHKKANDEIKAIQEREKNDIMALLSDTQKTELKTLMDSEAADRKMKAADRKKGEEGATEKSEGAGPAGS